MRDASAYVSIFSGLQEHLNYLGIATMTSTRQGGGYGRHNALRGPLRRRFGLACQQGCRLGGRFGWFDHVGPDVPHHLCLLFIT